MDLETTVVKNPGHRTKDGDRDPDPRGRTHEPPDPPDFSPVVHLFPTIP